MPWTEADVSRFNSKITSDKDKATWVKVANTELARCQKAKGKDCEGRAVRVANSVFEKVKKNIFVELKKINLDKRLVGGVVLRPNVPDLQGDIYDEETVEKAAHDFLEDVRIMGVMHEKFKGFGVPVESFIAPTDIILEKKAGKPTQEFKKGDWVMITKVTDDDVLQKIESGEYTGFSIGAVAQCEDIVIEPSE
jgi:hypothetical protein